MVSLKKWQHLRRDLKAAGFTKVSLGAIAAIQNRDVMLSQLGLQEFNELRSTMRNYTGVEQPVKSVPGSLTTAKQRHTAAIYDLLEMAAA